MSTSRGTLLHLNARAQALRLDAGGHNTWVVETTPLTLAARQTALLLCDVWDKHWSRGASERVEAMVPRMNEVVKAARALGVTIIHAPSDTMEFYRGTPARQRMMDAPRVEMPPAEARPAPPLPIDDSDGGSDTGEPSPHKAWTRQHPGIEIDEEKDGVSDSGPEVWSFLRQRGIENALILGVHTNMCVLNRPFAIKALASRGMNVCLLRDLTDAMYNPARAPYVSHAEGTRLVIEYIEKFWAASLHSDDLLDAHRRPLRAEG